MADQQFERRRDREELFVRRRRFVEHVQVAERFEPRDLLGAEDVRDLARRGNEEDGRRWHEGLAVDGDDPDAGHGDG